MAPVKGNYHTHSLYSDGKAPIQEYVDEAARLGLEYLGFSEHSPLPFPNNFALPESRVNEYVGEVRNINSRVLQDGVPLPLLFAGMEIDYIPGISQDFAALKNLYNLDYIIGSVHLVLNPDADGLWFIDGPSRQIYDDGLQVYFNGDIREAVTAYFRQVQRMIREEEIDILGHFDKIKMHNQNRFFTEDEDWYRELLMETIEEIAARNIIVEVNTRGLYKQRSDSLFPGVEILKQLCLKNIPVLISSDAHAPAELTALFDLAMISLEYSGFSSISYLTAKGWQKTGIRELL